MNSNLPERYKRLNNSFKKKIVFHLGVEAGFFSEYNNMILAMLYCLENNIAFSLYSADANFGYKDGWSDYFLSFCEDKDNINMPFFHDTACSFHKKYNVRNHLINPVNFNKKELFKIWWYKHWNNVDYLTQDLWRNFHNRKMEKLKYQIPELDINGDILDATKRLISITWRYNQETGIAIDKLKQNLNLPAEYIGFHIRRGDKKAESSYYSSSQYIEKAVSLNLDVKNIFVSTDDYSIIREMKSLLPGSYIYTLCSENDSGYKHSEFHKQSKDDIKDAFFNLFASIDILSQSNRFIGTFSSNIGMFLGMKMEKGSSIGIDFDRWRIW